MASTQGFAASLKANGADWIIPAFTVSLVFVMLVPLPSFILDLLLTLSITISVLVLLSAVQICGRYSFPFSPVCYCS